MACIYALLSGVERGDGPLILMYNVVLISLFALRQQSLFLGDFRFKVTDFEVMVKEQRRPVDGVSCKKSDAKRKNAGNYRPSVHD